jgi:adenosylhomocysteinase
LELENKSITIKILIPDKFHTLVDLIDPIQMHGEEVNRMVSSRIKDPELVAKIDEGQLAWQRYITPLTEHYCQQIVKKDYNGKRLAYWGHIGYDLIPMLLALKQAGAKIATGACNLDSTDDTVAAYLVSKGVRVYGWSGMSQSEYKENLRLIRNFEADYLCDMGGEMIVEYLDKTPPVKGALEGTTSGLHQLRQHYLSFPIFDWNSIPLKENLENRFHVGEGVWSAFCQVTGLGLFGRRVLLIGYGPVGKGIAERARNLGAIVYVTELNPMRLIEARFHGCETISLEKGLACCDIIVTATGVEGVLRQDQLSQIKTGAILFNAGHSSYEVDINWLYSQLHQRMKAHIEQFEVGNTTFFLLAKGNLLNLATGAGPHGIDTSDHYFAIMLAGIAWMFDGIPYDIQPGLLPYPAHLEQEIALLSSRIYSEC